MSASATGLKWRRAIAAASALSLFSTAAEWFTGSDQGTGAAIVFGSPALLVGTLAGWWAWRGYAVRPTPPLVIAALWAMVGGAITFALVFAAMLLIGGTDNNLAGLPAVFAAPIGALIAAVAGFLRQRNLTRSQASAAG